MIIDLFAGGGGASLGIQWATGRAPDLAVSVPAGRGRGRAGKPPRENAESGMKGTRNGKC